MRVRRIRNWSEQAVGRILESRLSRSQFEIFGPIPIDSVLEREKTEWLSNQDFDLYSRGSFDFCICDRLSELPLFVVEFDGPHHESLEQRRRDIRKNNFCKQAELPLLRITSNEVAEHDQWTALDFILYRYSKWQTVKSEIEAEIHDHLESISQGGCLIGSIEPDPCWDPAYLFSLRYPLPAIEQLKRRIIQRLKAASKFKARGWSIDFIRDSIPSRLDWSEDGFVTCEHAISMRSTAHVRAPEIIKFEGRCRIRCCLPLDLDIPKITSGSELFTDDFIEILEKRIKYLWHVGLPGIALENVAANFAEHMAFRSLENWVDSNLQVA